MKPMKQWLLAVVGVWLFQGCGGSESFKVVIAFPDQAAKEATTTLLMYSIIPGEGASCQTLMDGTNSPGDSLCQIEDVQSASNPFTDPIYPLKVSKKNTKTRLFFCQGENDVGKVIFVGCSEVTSGNGEHKVSITLIQANFNQPPGVFNRVTSIYTGSSSAPIPLSGVTVDALDNVTGVQLTDTSGAALEKVSGSNGSVSFTIAAKKVAFKANGLTVSNTIHYVDTITSNCAPIDKDPTLFMLEFQIAYLMAIELVGNLPMYAADAGQKAFFAGILIWNDANGNSFPVGCAIVTFENEDGTISGLTNYNGAGGYPDAAQKYTHPTSGRFEAISLKTGKTTVRAFDKDSGAELTDPANPNIVFMVKSNDYSSDISTAVFPTNPRPAINLSNIYVKQTATNPTQVGCQ